MYKIILADDEPFIVRGVKKMVDWQRLNAEVVGEAENGTQLIALIEELQPDIVISDISMPKSTGLDVIKEIKDRDLDTKVIFMSAYQEFEYAKKAIQYGAVDYLLKPVEEQELEESIIKAIQMLRDRPQNLSPEQTLESLEDMHLALRNMNSSYESRSVYQQFQEMGVDVQGKIFAGVCFVIAPEKEKEIGDKHKFELMKFSVFKRIQGFIKDEKLGFLIKRDDSSCNMILILPTDDSEKGARDIIERTREMVLKEADIPLNIGVGQTVSEVKNVKLAYKTAKLSSELYYFQQDSDIYYNDIQREFTTSFDDFTNAYKVFLNAVLNRDKLFMEDFRNCLEMIEQLHFGNRYAAENRCVVMAWDLFKDLKEYHLVPDQSETKYGQRVEGLRKPRTFQELKKRFTDHILEFVQEMFSASGSMENSTIHQVKQYISEHYARNVSLHEIAKMVYMNPYYFSTFFKKETGQNFKNYVTEVRMQKALQLLMKTEMKTYELAEAVGYKDVGTFTEKFREVYGDSPSVYKKKKS